MRKPILISLGLAALGAGVYAYACRETRQYRREFIRAGNRASEGKQLTLDGKNRRELGMLEGARHSEASSQIISSTRDITPAPDDGVKRLRILHISDLHLARNEVQSKLDFLAEVTDDEYDFVFLTGDIFQHDESIKHARHLLSRKPRIGAYAVLGNHDYYRYSMWNKIVGRIFPSMRHPAKITRDVKPLVRALKNVGYDVLLNEARYLEDTEICLVGVDWPGIRKNKLLELVSRSPGDWLVIALFHLPRDLEFYNDAGVHYAFGGHTHGGQIRVPGYGPIITDSELARHEASGITYRGRTTFHISRGLGADPRTNFRLFCPPQASVIEIEVPANCSLANRMDFSVIGAPERV